MIRIIFIISFLIGIVFLPSPTQVNLDYSFLSPFQNWIYPFGADRLGRNIYGLYCYGILSAILISIPARIITLFFSTLISLFVFWSGKYFRILFNSISSVFISLPSLLVALVIVFALGKIIIILFFSIIVSDWASSYESIEAKIREIKDSGYVISARNFGAGEFYIFRKHIFPELKSMLGVLFVTGIPSVIMTISIYSYLGIDFGSDTFGPGLGEQISFSRDYFMRSPLSIVIPILGIFLLISAFYNNSRK